MAKVVRLTSELAKEARKNFVLLFRIHDDGNHSAKGVGEKDVSTRTGFESMQNPLRVLRLLDGYQWLMLSTASFALFADYFDIYGLSIQTVKFSAYYNISKAKAAQAITFSLLPRSIGAIVFGLMGDFMGRKWPLVINLTALGVFQIGSIFCKNISAFIGSRALFGMAMGGIWGCSAAAVLETCPSEAKGFVSGILSSTISIAYIVAAGANWGFGPDPETWKNLFWVGAGLSFLAAIFRALVPESAQFRIVKECEETISHQSGAVLSTVATGGSTLPPAATTKRQLLRHRLVTFCRHLKTMMRLEWKIFVYTIIFVAVGVWYASAVITTYTTFLIAGKGFSNADASKASMIMKSGGIPGCLMSGYLSEHIGRRRVIVFWGIVSCLFVPALVLPTSMTGLALGGFALMFCTHGMSGVYPIHLNELAPPAFRAILSGVAIQVGGTIAAPAAQTAISLSERFHTVVNGKEVPAYGPVIGIMLAILALLKVILVAIGPERRGISFEYFVPAVIDSVDTSSERLPRSSGSKDDLSGSTIQSKQVSALSADYGKKSKLQ